MPSVETNCFVQLTTLNTPHAFNQKALSMEIHKNIWKRQKEEFSIFLPLQILILNPLAQSARLTLDKILNILAVIAMSVVRVNDLINIIYGYNIWLSGVCISKGAEYMIKQIRRAIVTMSWRYGVESKIEAIQLSCTLYRSKQQLPAGSNLIKWPSLLLAEIYFCLYAKLINAQV